MVMVSGKLAAGTADAGKPAAGIAAVQALLHHLLNDGPEIPIFPQEPALVFQAKEGKDNLKLLRAQNGFVFGKNLNR